MEEDITKTQEFKGLHLNLKESAKSFSNAWSHLFSFKLTRGGSRVINCVELP